MYDEPGSDAQNVHTFAQACKSFPPRPHPRRAFAFMASASKFPKSTQTYAAFVGAFPGAIAPIITVGARQEYQPASAVNAGRWYPGAVLQCESDVEDRAGRHVICRSGLKATSRSWRCPNGNLTVILRNGLVKVEITEYITTEPSPFQGLRVTALRAIRPRPEETSSRRSDSGSATWR